MALRRSLRCHSPPTDGKGRQKKEGKRDDFKYHGHFISFSLSFSRLSRLDFVRERKTFFKALRELIHVASTAKNKISVRISKVVVFHRFFYRSISKIHRFAEAKNHLHVRGRPPHEHLGPPGLRVGPPGQHPVHPSPDALSGPRTRRLCPPLQPVHPLPHPLHHARVEKVKVSGGEEDLAAPTMKRR